MILVCDADPLYREISTTILSRGNYQVTQSNSLAHAIELIRNEKFEAALVDFNVLPRRQDRLNIGKIRTFISTTSIPVLFTTEENIDQYLELILHHGMNMVLSKPMKRRELLTALQKSIQKTEENCFGLENYLTEITEIRRMEIRRSTQIRTAIEKILKQVEEWGFPLTQKFEMDLVWQELLINALYHSHGYSEQKMQRMPIELPKPYFITVRYGYGGDQFAISIRDYAGTLTPVKIVDSLYLSVEQQTLLERSMKTGEDISNLVKEHGRGLDLVRRMVGEYYFVMQPGKSTEVVTVYERHYEKDDPFTSLKILELPGG